MIAETIVTTQNEDGSTHIAPIGVREHAEELILAPFKPSKTLDNMLRECAAVINCTADVRIFAGCFAGHYDWKMIPAKKIAGKRLASTLSHREVNITRVKDDVLRPRCYCRVVWSETHAPFGGFNRAQAAVIELAILVSRLERLPQEKIDREIAYLQTAVNKTAGENERTAWQWLIDEVEQFRQRPS